MYGKGCKDSIMEGRNNKLEWINVKWRLLFVVLIMSVGLVACGGQGAEGNKENVKPEKDIKELVNDYSVGKITDETASITSTQLVVTDKDEKKTNYDLPKDEFFVSIAPFINETHPCEIHNLTGCQGELVDVDFDFHIEDEEGNVVLSETLNSEANGFVDIWLPRDKTFNVKVTYDGKEVDSKISTFEKDGTCVTTMQLT